jgi:Domain of unknown function (DUF4337)
MAFCKERVSRRRTRAGVSITHGVHGGAHGGEHGANAPKWVPIAAAVLALLAASCGLMANLRVTLSNATRSNAIIDVTRAADAYNEYDGRSVRQHIYEAAIENASDPARIARLRSVADREAAGKAPLLAKAKALDKQSQDATLEADHILKSHEILEVATTLFEISIVLVSITALVGGRLLPICAASATGVGIVIALIGLFY